MNRKYSSLIAQAAVACATTTGATTGFFIMPMMARMNGYTWGQVVEQTFRQGWGWQNAIAHTFFTIAYGMVFGYFAHVAVTEQREEVSE